MKIKIGLLIPMISGVLGASDLDLGYNSNGSGSLGSVQNSYLHAPSFYLVTESRDGMAISEGRSKDSLLDSPKSSESWSKVYGNETGWASPRLEIFEDAAQGSSQSKVQSGDKTVQHSDNGQCLEAKVRKDSLDFTSQVKKKELAGKRTVKEKHCCWSFFKCWMCHKDEE